MHAQVYAQKHTMLPKKLQKNIFFSFYLIANMTHISLPWFTFQISATIWTEPSFSNLEFSRGLPCDWQRLSIWAIICCLLGTVGKRLELRTELAVKAGHAGKWCRHSEVILIAGLNAHSDDLPKKPGWPVLSGQMWNVSGNTLANIWKNQNCLVLED